MKEFFKRTLTALLLVATFSGAYLHSSLLFIFLLVAIFLVILFTEWPRLLPVKGFEGIVFSLFYPVLPMAALIMLHVLYYPQDFYLSLYPFCIAWSADTYGYVIGKLLGWHKICPSISPGKSWQGLAGSFLGVVGINFLILPYIEAPFALVIKLSSVWILEFSALLTGVAFLGGLLLSYFKRSKNVKDAGTVLPGHGGFLDRFDGVFAVVLVLWVALLWPTVFEYIKKLSTTSQSLIGIVNK